MADPIVIHHVEPTGDKGEQLKGCYYVPNEIDPPDPKKDRTFDFYDKDGTLKASDVRIRETIKFQLGGDTEYSLTATLIDTKRVVGDWGTLPETGVGEPEGTYQGQAGGGFDVESAATAGSY